jgi:putative transposase
MTLNQSALLELTDVLRTADGGKVMRLMLSAILQALVDAEATAQIGANPRAPDIAMAVRSPAGG